MYGLNRTLYRRRYVEGIGWVTSTSPIYSRIQGKNIGKLVGPEKDISFTQFFLPNVVFCDTPPADETSYWNRFIDGNYNYPASGDFYNQAATGIDTRQADRLYEPDTGKEFIIRSIGSFRDFRMPHDEITASENSLLDKGWTETFLIKKPSFPNNNYNPYYDQEFIRTPDQYSPVASGFGLVLNPQGGAELAKLLEVLPEGKQRDEIYSVVIDGIYDVDENDIINFRGEDYEVKYLQETIYRINIAGVALFKKGGTFQEKLIGNITNREL